MKKLKVTKQSLNRILKDLIKLDVISFEKDKKDSRLKHVFKRKRDKNFLMKYFLFKKRIYRAFLNSKSEEVLFFDNVLKKIINE